MENSSDSTTPSVVAQTIAALKLRGIGPALMGGRISDIAVHPQKRSTWYVSAGSGGLWKTINAGTTWTPVFDKQPSYSIGCITIDPNTPSTVWVGTGENVSGRHVAWGDGIYRSTDAGATWSCMGLNQSEHISKILIDPRDSNVIIVAVEGPLWSAGGERGVYRSSDGGTTWEAALTVDDDTGATDLHFDPSNPDIVYAATYQRRRRTWALMAGGPGSGLYKSADNGKTWRKLTTGLPKGDMGKIGLAVTAANPELVYATIEAGEKEKGFYRSTDRGESWEKRNKYLSGGTGPHYYQQIEASPTDPERVYQMDVFMHMTADGGKTFNRIETGREKHSDNHALWIDSADGDHLIQGCDAGLYESFDHGATWRHFPNLPISQFYRCDVDNSEPFYNILGGAQDLGTLYGPSRTLNLEGVRNQDWWVPLGADGYHVAFNPTDPNQFFLEFQNGNVFRYDLANHDIYDIKPFAKPGEAPNRWNWDTPIKLSPHNPQRVYVAAQRVWRSDDSGSSWTTISPDLTRNENRFELPIMGRVHSVDALYDLSAMSKYATISTFAESAVAPNILYAGTDDGLIQASEDGGETWRQCAPLPSVPENAFIQCVEPSQHAAGGVFVAADAHKEGDYTPYLFVSDDFGRSWRSIRGDLPDGTILWVIQQDHVKADLLFLGAEYGAYVSVNGGDNWHKLSGIPPIAVRDLKLHRRDDDLICSTFGRGFYILDDYASLRELVDETPDGEGHLFPLRDAWQFDPYMPMQGIGQPTVGSSSFKADNPPHGAVFTYYIADGLLDTSKAQRHAAEKKLRTSQSDIPFPGFDALNAEMTAPTPKVMLVIRDSAGNTVRNLAGAATAGVHRTAWNMREASAAPIQLNKKKEFSPWMQDPVGPCVVPGAYSAELMLVSADGVRSLSEKQTFTLKPLPTKSADADIAAARQFQLEATDLTRRMSGATAELQRATQRLKHLQAAVVQTAAADLSLYGRIDALLVQVAALEAQLGGDAARQKLNESAELGSRQRAIRITLTSLFALDAPSATQRETLDIAQAQFAAQFAKLSDLIDSALPELEAEFEAAGAPWTPGRQLP